MHISLVPAPQPPRYLITIDRMIDGKRAHYSPDREVERDSKRNIIEDIISGELEHVSSIIEIREDEGTCRNVTEDIARDVLNQAVYACDELPRLLIHWLHEQIGPYAVEAEIAEAMEG